MELGWIEGRNIEIDFRWPGGDIEQVQTFARELVGLRPEVLVGRSSPATAALKRQAPNIPIVFANIIEPVEQGFVQNLARPGGNITGFINFEPSIGGKWLQLLKEIDPRIARVAVLYNPHTAPYAGSFLRSVQSAAPTFSVEASAAPVESDADIEAALTRFAIAGGLIAIPDSFTAEHRQVLITLARRHHLPTIYQTPVFVRDGGLLSYGPDVSDILRRSASYVDRILRGAKPSDLPVQLPVKFEMAINVETAKALDLVFPQSILLRADEVIE
jgi:putative ABC transport system substrate-binding protein